MLFWIYFLNFSLDYGIRISADFTCAKVVFGEVIFLLVHDSAVNV